MKQALIGAGSGLVVGLIALSLLLFGPLSPNNGSDLASDSVTQSAAAEIATSSAAVSSTVSESLTLLEPCSVKELEEDAAILQLQAEVRDAATGTVLFDRSANVAARAASVQKLLTAAAALQVLGPNYTAITRVYQDQLDPGVLYFVGGGDVTLSRLTGSKQSVYKNAPKLEVLAASALRKLSGQPITRIVTDSTLYGGASGEYLGVWDKRGLTEGYMSYVSALQVDGDRDNPIALASKRSTDPVKRAGDWFKRALGPTAAGAKVEKGEAPANAVEIAQISSRPISEWISYMLQVSDNTLAEALGRLISLNQRFDGSSATLTNAFRSALATTGLDFTGVKIEDGSGLSRYNQVSPKLVNDLLTLVAKNEANLGQIRAGLPVAGSPGSLSDRFAELTGKVTAKTGWIRSGYTMAGFLKAADESELIFTAYNLSESVNASNRDALDALVAGFQACGLALANR